MGLAARHRGHRGGVRRRPAGGIEPVNALSDTVIEADAHALRTDLAQALAERGVLDDPMWRKAVETVPRHRFVPGFYLPADQPSTEGLTVWEPVTAASDYGRWLGAAYTDTTLITQFDGDEPDWDHPAPRDGGAPTSSSTLPSLVMRMWADSDLRDGHTVLEVGTGTGYSTALACELLGSDAVTSIEVDPHRLNQAATVLYSCGYTPDLAVADGLYGYWPSAPFDRIVAACSVRTIPPAWPAQTRPGGKILTTLGGWMYGYARVLLTVHNDRTASGPLLPGTISFMAARAQEAPTFGNPAHWDSLRSGDTTQVRHTPERITDGTDEAFFTRFLAQCAAPNAQLTTTGEVVHLVDVVSGSAATLTPTAGTWRLRQSGPLRLWDQIETVLDAYDAAGRPRPETFRLHVDEAGQRLRHPQLPDLKLPTWA
jgi:methyltransferase of ATP-grasp peptide maturase system